jgi:protein-disulfide isomerase
MKAFLALLAVGTAFGTQIPPIPSKPEGFVLGPTNATVVLDVFYDHLCSASRDSYPGLYAYWKSNQSWLQLRIHILPLPYHYLAFEVTQAGKYIELNYPNKFIPFLEYIFANQGTYLSKAKSQVYADNLATLAKDTSIATGVSQEEIANALANKDVNWATRVSRAFAVSRRISGTPQYIVNGVYAPDASENSSQSDWTYYFNLLSEY